MSAIQLLLSSVHQAGLHCNNIFGITLHSHIQLCRYKSRCLLISFKSPSVGPRSATERTARAKLESALLSFCYSTAVGWIISLESQLCDGVEEVHHIEAQLQEMPAFANMPRQCIGWALLIFFTSKVCMSVSDICIVACCTVENKFTSTHVQLN